MARTGGRTTGKGHLFAITNLTPDESKVLNSRRIKAMILNELKDQGKRAKSLLNLTTEYWKDKPTFKDILRYAGGDVYVMVHAFGKSTAVDHWEKVNAGTSVRYVYFTKDYRPKTAYDEATGRGTLGTNFPGTGARAGMDRSRPRPGIRGRHWDMVIYELMEGDFAVGIRNAIKRGLQPK